MDSASMRNGGYSSLLHQPYFTRYSICNVGRLSDVKSVSQSF